MTTTALGLLDYEDVISEYGEGEFFNMANNKHQINIGIYDGKATCKSYFKEGTKVRRKIEDNEMWEFIKYEDKFFYIKNKKTEQKA